jgi:hypothetical protein
VTDSTFSSLNLRLIAYLMEIAINPIVQLVVQDLLALTVLGHARFLLRHKPAIKSRRHSNSVEGQNRTPSCIISTYRPVPRRAGVFG